MLREQCLEERVPMILLQVWASDSSMRTTRELKEMQTRRPHQIL